MGCSEADRMHAMPPTEAQILFDGDFLAFVAASAVEHETDWGDGMWTLHSFVQDAIDSFESQMSAQIKAVEQALDVTTSEIILCFSDPKHNFRKDVYSQYKANRKSKRKPVCYKALREYLDETYGTIMYPTLEGDDVCGILATSGKYSNPIIVSADKDFKTIPATFFDTARGTSDTIDELEANYWHLYQTLIGDTTDGYPGCKGIGPVAATKLLDSAVQKQKPLWDTVVEAYSKAGFDEEYALVQARCAFILRADHYDETTGDIKLWTPK
jgi:DNA polymerase-1